MRRRSLADQPVHIWALAALASALECVYIIAANIAVEISCCPASHLDLDDTLPWIWAATAGVQVVYFLGVWVTEDLTKNQWPVACASGVM